MPSNSRLFVKPFIGGLNTELSSVEDAILNTSDELNCTILPEGIRGRRLGFNIERDGQWVESNDSTITSVFYWSNVGKKDFDYILVQRGTNLYICDQDLYKTVTELDLKQYIVTDVMGPLKYAQLSGDLIIVNDNMWPLKLSWDFTNSVLNVEKINIKWRDLVGIDDGLAIDETPATLSPEHKYNLYNQGWDKWVYDEDNTKSRAIDKFFEESGKTIYPSNSMLHYLDKRNDASYDVYEILKHHYGNTPAPKGHFILDYFTRSRSKASGIQVEESTVVSEKKVFTLAKNEYWEKMFGNNMDILTSKVTGAAGYPTSEECFDYEDGGPRKKFGIDYSGTISSFSFAIRDFSRKDGGNYEFGDEYEGFYRRNHEYIKDVPWYSNNLEVSLIGVKGNEETVLKTETYRPIATNFVGSIYCEDTWVFEQSVTYDSYYINVKFFAAPGEYIRLMPYWNIFMSVVTEDVGLPSEDVVNGRIKDVLSFSGRYFYLVGNTVLFSQVLNDTSTNYDRCYQEADPTSEEINDVVVTDGGYVKFPSTSALHAIKSFNRGVIVFGDSEVFGLISPSDQMFSATGYDIVELSKAGLIGSDSVVSVSDAIFYWSPLGIFRIGVSEQTGNTLVAQTVSINTIQEYYNNIPTFAKEHCKGVFDYVNNRIYWYYPSNENRMECLDMCLVLDLSHNSFMAFKVGESVDESLPIISNVCETPRARQIKPTMYVRVNGDRVVVNGTPVIATEEESAYDRWTSLKHVIINKNSFSFGDYNSREFKDFDKHSYDSYMVSRPIMFAGFSTFGNVVQDTANDKQVPILQTLFKRTEQSKLADGKNYIAASGANIRVRWGWSLTDRSNRWDMVQNGYRPQKDFLHDEYVESRIHVRGRGKAFQVEIRNDDNKDFRLAGMNILVRSR